MSERGCRRSESPEPPEHRQFSNPDGDSNEEFFSREESSSGDKSNSITQQLMYPREKVSVIAIGNPGAGKSTILNSLAGEVLFKSGISLGDGLTFQLDQQRNDKGTFFDTPGLADDTKREGASKAISTALRKGGPFKIIFFVRLDNGRIVVEDKTTMKIVLDSAPEIGKKYGIVTNKIQNEVIELIQKPGGAEKLVVKLYAGIPEENRCDPASITYLPYKPEADAKENHLLHSSSLMTSEGSSLVDFVYDCVETVQLTKGQAKDIDIGNFDETTKRLQHLETELEKSKAMYHDEQEKLHNWMEKAERDKEEMYAKTMEMFNQQDDMMRRHSQHETSRREFQQDRFDQQKEKLDEMLDRDRDTRQKRKDQCNVM